KQTSYLDLYKYFYYATSSLVHFRPDILGKMGWARPNQDGNIETFTFSVKNFNHYYLEFNIVYGTYLFREYLLNFEDDLCLSSDIAPVWISKIEKLLNR